ncbi:hypothetical protein DFH28DRAFT_1112609 [Melampsora americana]|nr:hypothetical protein DFH28DRAFT_1112609 [Melampsora americana]
MQIHKLIRYIRYFFVFVPLYVTTFSYTSIRYSILSCLYTSTLFVFLLPCAISYFQSIYSVAIMQSFTTASNPSSQYGDYSDVSKRTAYGSANAQMNSQITTHQSSQMSPHHSGGSGQYHHDNSSSQYGGRPNHRERSASYGPANARMPIHSTPHVSQYQYNDHGNDFAGPSQPSDHLFLRGASVASTTPEFEAFPTNTQQSTQPSQHLKRRLGDHAAVTLTSSLSCHDKSRRHYVPFIIG